MSDPQNPEIPRLAHICKACKGTGQVITINTNHMRRLRVNAGFGLREAATKVNISAAFLSDMELGRRNMSERIALSLIKLYMKGEP